jgi:hypothetical protein
MKRCFLAALAKGPPGSRYTAEGAHALYCQTSTGFAKKAGVPAAGFCFLLSPPSAKPFPGVVLASTPQPAQGESRVLLEQFCSTIRYKPCKRNIVAFLWALVSRFSHKCLLFNNSP